LKTIHQTLAAYAGNPHRPQGELSRSSINTTSCAYESEVDTPLS
jgi:hypothetical protein